MEDEEEKPKKKKSKKKKRRIFIKSKPVRTGIKLILLN